MILTINSVMLRKSKNVEEVIDKIHLKELDNLSKTDTTDKNKKNLLHFKKILITISCRNLRNIKRLLINYLQIQMMLKST